MNNISPFLGTPCYFAPELKTADKKRYSNAVDWYSLGCLGYDLVYGEHFQKYAHFQKTKNQVKEFNVAQTLVCEDPTNRYNVYDHHNIAATPAGNRDSIGARRARLLTVRAEGNAGSFDGGEEAQMDTVLSTFLATDSATRKCLSANPAMLVNLFCDIHADCVRCH